MQKAVTDAGVEFKFMDKAAIRYGVLETLSEFQMVSGIAPCTSVGIFNEAVITFGR